MAISFVVSPIKQEIDLKSGQKYEGKILVTNPKAATENFSYKVTVKPYFVTGDEAEPDIETISDWSKIVNWITVDEPTGTLAPNESREVRFTIDVPKSAPTGGQYAMIGVTSVSDTHENTSSLKDSFTMGSLILARMDGKTVHEGQILENYVPSFSAAGTPTTFVTVSNTGNVHETLTVNLKVKNMIGGQEISLTGEEVDEYKSQILPTSTRVVSRNLDGLPQLGIFEIAQEASYIDEFSSNTTVLLVCPIWFIVLVLLLIVTIIGTIAYKISKRRGKSLKNPKKQLHFENTDDTIES